MKILVGCEESQAITIALRAAGHEAFSCDTQECSGGHPEWHILGDVFEAAASRKWDAAIFHPPCTYLSVSGLHWNKRVPGRAQKTEDALIFVKRLMDLPIPMIALENPVSCISSRIRKPDQIIQPYEYGDDASKKTCLWLKGLPKLTPTEHVPGKLFCCGHLVVELGGVYECPNCGKDDKAKRRWANQTPSGQNKLGPGKGRAKDRSKTYPGIAEAIASQWFR